MKAGRFLAVVVAFMMVFAVMPVSLDAIPPPPEYVWVAVTWNVDVDGNITDEGFDHLEFGVNAFESIQVAIDAVAEDGVVNVLPGTYYEGVTGDYSLIISTDGITVQGVRSDKSVIADYEDEDIPVIEGQSHAGHLSYGIEADNVTLSGLHLLPQPGEGNWVFSVLHITGEGFTLEHCLIDDAHDRGNDYALIFYGEGAISARVEYNRLEGSIGLVEPDTGGAGTGSVFRKNEIYAANEPHFVLSRVPGVHDTLTIEGNSFLGSGTGYLVSSFDDDDNHPAAPWMFDIFGDNDMDEAYAIVKNMDTLELREMPALSSYVYGYSSFSNALGHAEPGDTIFCMPPVVDGALTLDFAPEEMPDDSSLAINSFDGNPIAFIPMAGIDGEGTHTASVQLSWDDGGLAIPEGYDFLRRMVLTIEGPGVTDGQFVEGNPAQIWVVSLPEGIDADTVLLLRYNEVTEEWEEQDKEIDENGTLIFTTPQWSDFVFVMETAEEPPEETPETGTAVMWLIPFGALLLLAGWGLRRRAVA